ncbi:MAG: hypothetical protein ACPG43_06920 [Alcanivoracaceae bacterium]
MPKKMSETASKLLEAQVAYTLDQLQGKALRGHVESNVDFLLEAGSKLRLADLVSEEMIRATALKYASDMEPGPGLAEMVAEIARQLHGHPGHDQCTLRDLVDDRMFDEVLGKVIEMKSVREQIVHDLVGNPLYSELIADVLYHGIRNYMTDNPLTKRLPGAQSMMKLGKSMMDKATPNIEDAIRRYIQKNINSSLRESERFLIESLDDRRIDGVARDVWAQVREEPISRFQDYVGEDDLEDFFVIGFEYWRRLRTTDYYRSLVDAGVDFFFNKYGKTPVTDIIADVGVSRDMIVEDAMHYLPHILKVLKKKGVLEDWGRQTLEGFYLSDAVAEILADA